ncbi:MAG: succinate--CoA ligase subunit alpha [Caldisericia bacterium]|jgi:succinyl-CoA synthetase alpha subunit|nr:succinate--CoA ligase subunit alpha [Caldisericia bacterium]HOJ16438.1 succinate--CoA ligase subunit alpha [Caldisericia bacterium]HOW03003.1 succinate--CoA ligase subunit alpha [Caldisericia bacterium]HPO29430.1 succinate--CoA ligase subunit alpha [Caldisericia bacterium]
MSILVNSESKIIVQGITGRDGSFHTHQMLSYGSKVVAGVTPGKGGTEIFGIPIFDTMKEAVKNTQANVSIIFVPERFAADSIVESADSGINLIVCITEGIPVNQMLKISKYLSINTNSRLIGPNCPGLISPGQCKVGIMPAQIFKEGNVGIVSRSGTLTYEVVYNLTKAGFGESTCIGIGGDQIVGTSFIDVLSLFKDDPQTEKIVLIGEIGGDEEEKAAEYIKNNISKRVVAFIAGRNAPPEKRMGHAGAVILQGKGTAESKVKAFEEAGVKVADRPSDIPELLK